MTNYPELSVLITTQVDEESSSDSADYKKKGAEKLLKIEPLELKFAFEPNKKMSCSLYLSNTTKNLVAFQVLANNTTNYAAEPNNGIILPHRTCGIKVEAQAKMKIPADMKCKDLIKIESVVLNQWDTVDMKQLFINKDQENYVQVCTLPVVYLFAPLMLSPLPKLSYFFLTENGNLNPFPSPSPSPSDQMTMISTIELLKIDQQELNFGFEVNKQISRSVKLTNVSEFCVAFEVKATRPSWKICVEPNRGILLPGSSCDVIVTMQAQKKTRGHKEEEEEFVNIQSTIVSPRIVEEFVGRKTKTKINTNEMEHMEIAQTKLNIPFEANKQISPTVQLRNSSSENYVACKVKATNPNKFHIQPSVNMLFPGSSCDFIVTMQDQKALSVQHNEEFLIQCLVISPEKFLGQHLYWKTEQVVDWDMLNAACGLVREYKLKLRVAAYTTESESQLPSIVGNNNIIHNFDVSQESLWHTFGGILTLCYQFLTQLFTRTRDYRDEAEDI